MPHLHRINKYNLILFGIFHLNSLACEDSSRTVAAGTYLNLMSEQYEYFSSGSRILKESGVLPGGVVSASISCNKFILSGELSQTSGSRDYVGLSSNGSTVLTTSKIKQDVSLIRVGWEIVENFSILADTVRTKIDREIISTPNAQGYPEFYEKNFVRLGAQWTVSKFNSLWSASILASIYGQQDEAVQLPGKDKVNLSFEEPRQWEINLNFKKNFSKSTFVQIQYKNINTLSTQSKVSVLTSGGNPVGVVSQPKTWNIDQPLALMVGFAF